jgi:co-chaperonin GroES (HSP10)
MNVYFKKYSGDEIERDGKIYFIIDEEDLLCVVDD